MTSDDERYAHGEHIVEITQAAHERNVQRYSLAALGVAICLALAAVGITAGIVETKTKQRDAEAARDALDGWQTLGALAAGSARMDDAPAASATTNPAQVESAPNVVIVNVPQAPGATAPVAATTSGAPLQIASPQSAPNQAPTGAQQGVTNGVPLATPLVAMPNVVAMPNGGAPLNAAGPAAGNAAPASSSGSALPSGNVAASNPTPTLPNDTVRANPTPSPSNAPGTAPNAVRTPQSYPGAQDCGLTTCNIDSVCCNPSCGICVAPGDECSQRRCG